jgi:hypothetical protein
VRNDPVLMIWQARNLRAEIEIFPETDEISKIVAETEMVLSDLILRILATRKFFNRQSLYYRHQPQWT